jgi:hypothetical protein
MLGEIDGLLLRDGLIEGLLDKEGDIEGDLLGDFEDEILGEIEGLNEDTCSYISKVCIKNPFAVTCAADIAIL